MQHCSQIKSDFHPGLHQQSPGGGCSHVNRRLTPPPTNRAFTLQCTHTGVKFKLNRNKWPGTFIMIHKRWILKYCSTIHKSYNQELALIISFHSVKVFIRHLVKAPSSSSSSPLLSLHCTHLTFLYLKTLSLSKRFLAFPSLCYLMPHSSKPS